MRGALASGSSSQASAIPPATHFRTGNETGTSMEKLEQQQLLEALMQVALLESKAVSVSIAEIIAYLQKKEHLAASGTFQGIENKFKFLGTVLETAARLPVR